MILITKPFFPPLEEYEGIYKRYLATPMADQYGAVSKHPGNLVKRSLKGEPFIICSQWNSCIADDY